MTKRELRDSVFELGKNRPMVIEIEGGVAVVRPKGCRTRIPINAAALWQRGVKAQVEAERRAKSKRRTKR